MNAASQALVAEKLQAPRGDAVDAAGDELEDGALGVSGGTAAQDTAIAAYGKEVFKEVLECL